MRHRIVLIILALTPLCTSAQGSNTSSTNDLKVTLKAEPGYKRQKRVVKTWSVYPTRRIVYDAPKGSTTDSQPLLTKTYIDPTQKRMPASIPTYRTAQAANVKAMKPVVAKASAIKANRAPASLAAATKAPKTAAVNYNKMAAQKPVSVKPVAKAVAVQTPAQAPTAPAPAVAQTASVPEAPVAAVVVEAVNEKQPLVLETMSIKAPKEKVPQRETASFSPYQAGMARVARASSNKKSAGMVSRQKIALNK